MAQKIVAQQAAESLVQESEQEKKRREQTERQRQEKERAAELQKLEAMCTAGDLMPAFEYYRNAFPAALKNAQTEARREKICDELNQDEMEKAEALLSGQKYSQALETLEQIPAEFVTTTTFFVPLGLWEKDDWPDDVGGAILGAAILGAVIFNAMVVGAIVHFLIDTSHRFHVCRWVVALVQSLILLSVCLFRS